MTPPGPEASTGHLTRRRLVVAAAAGVAVGVAATEGANLLIGSGGPSPDPPRPRDPDVRARLLKRVLLVYQTSSRGRIITQLVLRSASPTGLTQPSTRRQFTEAVQAFAPT